jgi:hypothetical protein
VSDPHIEEGQSGLNRRLLIKRMAVGAFAVPAIVSFQLDSLARAGTFTTKHPSHMYPNQTEPNQHKPPKHHKPHKPKPHKPKHKGKGKPKRPD